MNVLDSARRTLRVEAQAVLSLMNQLDERFELAVEMLLACRSKVVITGIGKSGLICKKIAATLSSTGTPALFLHPTEGIHGDLGILGRDDLVIAISNSGETEELLRILPTIKRFGLGLIAVTGNANSTLAKAGDVCLDISVTEEACPLGLAPTASTTVTLALGDALAVALLEQRGFSAEDFALFHPGGALGKRLLLCVEDLMHRGQEIPLVADSTVLKDALFEITSKRLGITGVVDPAGRLVGVFTDGDLRRVISPGYENLDRPIRELMGLQPKSIISKALAGAALNQMEKHSITALFVMADEQSAVPVGVVHLHDLLKAGIA